MRARCSDWAEESCLTVRQCREAQRTPRTPRARVGAMSPPGGEGDEEEARYDDVTGAPLNARARAIVERAAADARAAEAAAGGRGEGGSGDGEGAGEGGGATLGGAFASIPRVVLEEGTWKYVQVELSAPGEKRIKVRGCSRGAALAALCAVAAALRARSSHSRAWRRRQVVRSARVSYHPEVYELLMNELCRTHPSVRGRVVGGGRIKYDAQARTVSIYGYSKSFGRAPGCNERSAKMVSKAMPDAKVEWSDTGY